MMIDRCSNKVAITSQDRLQPMDKLDIAPLIMVTLPIVSSFFSTCGCFLRDGRSSSGDLPPLSLACGWPPGANGSPSSEWQHLQGFRVENPSGARKGGGRIDHRSGSGWPAWANWPMPISTQFGHPPLRSRGSSGNYALCPFHSRPRCRFFVHEVRSFTLQSPRVFLGSTLVLATIGSDLIKLINTNKTP
jgi:hypothetical protein